MKKVLLVFGLSLLSGLSACKVTEVVKSTVVADSVTTIDVNPSVLAITVGQSQQVTATPKNAAGVAVDGKGVTWTSSDPTKVSVNVQGVVTGIAQGTAIVTARSGAASTSIPVAVANVPVSTVILNPSSTMLFVGQNITPRIELRGPRDELLTNRFVEWTTSNPTVAAVSQLGTITALTPGTSTIRAASEGKSANFTLTVSIVPTSTVSITPPNSVNVGRITQLSLVIRDADGNVLNTTGRSITWTVSNPGIATVNSSGMVTGVSSGSTTVAVLVDGRLATVNISVELVAIDTVVVTPNDSTLRVGFTRQYTALAFDKDRVVIDAAALAGRTFVWSSETPAFLSASNAGLVLGVALGDATVRVAIEDKITRKDIKVIP
jgi:uncharacterized protein YjdB